MIKFIKNFIAYLLGWNESQVSDKSDKHLNRNIKKEKKMEIEILPKGGNIQLKDKIEAGLTKVELGLSWDESVAGHAFDADASALMIGTDGKPVKNGVIYYGLASAPNQPFSSKDESVQHSGDNRTGDAEGDDEVITVTLDKVPADVNKVVFVANIYQAKERNQTFGKNSECIATLRNADTKEVLVKVDLREDNSMAAGMIIAELYRHDGSWKFRSLLKEADGSLKNIVNGEF